MRAIEIIDPGPDSRLVIGEVPAPPLGPRDVRIAVRAAGVNRADLLQRRGLYPPPPGASEVLGLECAGSVRALGPEVSGLAEGDEVMALLPGGGYAETVVVDAGSVLRVPPSLSLEQAAGFMETFLTAYYNLFGLAAAPAGGRALIHGGGSGVGTAAISLCREAGVEPVVTCRASKVDRCLAHGASVAIDYEVDDFTEHARGVDVVLDCVGGAYLSRNLACLAPGGALVIIGLMGGARAELSLAPLLARRLRIFGSTLRGQRAAAKAQVVRGLVERFGEALTSGRLVPVVDEVFGWDEAQTAHDKMARGDNFGKLVLRVA